MIARLESGNVEVWRNGAEDWNRTSDTSIFSAVLYRLSYLGTAHCARAELRSYPNFPVPEFRRFPRE